MKEQTKDILEKLISDKKVKYNAYNDISKRFDTLYQAYLASEADSVEELFSLLPNNNGFVEKNLEYMNFIGENFSKFHVSKKVVKDSLFDDYKDMMTTALFCSIGRYAMSDYESRASKKFVNIVNGIVEESVSLLDVGSGSPWPISSLQFLEKYNKVTTMDEFDIHWDRFDLFEKLGLKVQNEYFTHFTPIKDFDTIVGSAPCSAITPIVEKCAKTKDKEYVINMCACCSPTGGMSGFVRYLKGKDRHLKCFVSRINKDTNSNEIFEARDDMLRMYGCDVYITNSSKHKDDIMEVMHNNLCRENKEEFNDFEQVSD